MSDAVVLTSLADRLVIAPGVAMPRLGLGTYRSRQGWEVSSAVTCALANGYRGIDTAVVYGNERGVGAAVRRSGLPREEVFVATKVWNADQGYRSTLQACRRSLERLGIGWIDLYLIHWPLPRYTRDTWRAMEELRANGEVRAIGVCNFLVHHLEELLSYAEVPPAVDQVELHPRLQQPELRAYCEAHGITLQAWAPIMRGRVAGIAEIVEIARRHAKTPAQVSIRWILQHGVTTIPKSVHCERIVENADVFGFALAEEEMAVIDSLDRGEPTGLGPDAFARLAWLTRRVHVS